MKRTRRIAFLLVTVLVMSLMSISAFAKGGKVNVPTAGEYYVWQNHYTYDEATDKAVLTGGEYVKSGSFTASYDKTGKIKSFIKYDDLGNVESKTTYKWKKDNIYKIAKITNDFDYDWKYDYNLKKSVKEKATLISSETGSSKYKYKGGKLSKRSSSSVKTYTDGKTIPKYENSSAKYSYLKNTAVGKVTDKVSGEKNYDVFEVTKKGQKKASGATKYEYAKNGVMKKVTITEKGTRANFSAKTTYNKYGYPTGYQSTYYRINDEGIGVTSTYSTVYTYVWGAKHCPSQIEWVHSYSSSTDTEPNEPSKYKIVVTGTKSVKQARNCDGFGRRVGLMSEY